MENTTPETFSQCQIDSCEVILNSRERLGKQQTCDLKITFEKFTHPSRRP